VVLAVLALAQPVGAQPPDSVRFGASLEMGDIAQAREWLEEGLEPGLPRRPRPAPA